MVHCVRIEKNRELQPNQTSSKTDCKYQSGNKYGIEKSEGG